MRKLYLTRYGRPRRGSFAVEIFGAFDRKGRKGISAKFAKNNTRRLHATNSIAAALRLPTRLGGCARDRAGSRGGSSSGYGQRYRPIPATGQVPLASLRTGREEGGKEALESWLDADFGFQTRMQEWERARGHSGKGLDQGAGEEFEGDHG